MGTLGEPDTCTARTNTRTTQFNGKQNHNENNTTTHIHACIHTYIHSLIHQYIHTRTQGDPRQTNTRRPSCTTHIRTHAQHAQAHAQHRPNNTTTHTTQHNANTKTHVLELALEHVGTLFWSLERIAGVPWRHLGPPFDFLRRPHQKHRFSLGNTSISVKTIDFTKVL